MIVMFGIYVDVVVYIGEKGSRGFTFGGHGKSRLATLRGSLRQSRRRISDNDRRQNYATGQAIIQIFFTQPRPICQMRKLRKFRLRELGVITVAVVVDDALEPPDNSLRLIAAQQ